MREYYERRAPEYDDWWNGTGLFATLDVACGTAFLGRHLPGDVVGLDASPAMLAIAAERLPRVVHGDALDPPFADGAFDRVAAGHFYGHLQPPERARFLAAARRLRSVAGDEPPGEAGDPRVLKDGSRHAVFKRWFEPEQLADELGGGAIVHAGRWFVAVLA